MKVDIPNVVSATTSVFHTSVGPDRIRVEVEVDHERDLLAGLDWSLEDWISELLLTTTAKELMDAIEAQDPLNAEAWARDTYEYYKS